MVTTGSGAPSGGVESQATGATRGADTAVPAREDLTKVREILSKFHFSEKAIDALLPTLSPDAVGLLVALNTKGGQVTEADIQRTLGLNDQQMAESGVRELVHWHSVASPWADALMSFLVLAKQLGIDLVKLLQSTREHRLDLALEAAQERFNAAKAEFIGAMVGGAIFILGGVASLGKIYQAKQTLMPAEAGAGAGAGSGIGGKPVAEFNPMDPKWAWLGPQVSQQLSGLAGSIGQYLGAEHKFEAEQRDAEAAYLDSVLQQINSLMSSSDELASSAARAAAI